MTTPGPEDRPYHEWPPQQWPQHRWPPPPPPVYPPPWAKLPTPPPHDVPRPFLHVMRSRTWAWWKPLLGLLLLAGVYAVSAIAAVALAVVALLRTGRGILAGLANGDLTDPRVLLVTNISLMVAIPVVWLVWAAVHQMRIGWSSSVRGRLRWRLFLPWTVLALATLGPGIALSILLGVGLGAPFTGPVPEFGWLLVVVLLTTPLQSAAEEYVFRGYLSQAIAGWFRAERIGAVVAGLLSAILFSLAHAPPDRAAFLDRFAVGLAASAVVRLTGGLEAAIALHTVNNVLVFVLAGALGESATTDGVPGAGALDVVLTVLAPAGYVALVAVLRRRVRPDLTTAAVDLRPGAVPSHPDPSGIVSPWRREAPNSPWGMG
jgi:membrane protease YdiL (CAAX protease family)